MPKSLLRSGASSALALLAALSTVACEFPGARSGENAQPTELRIGLTATGELTTADRTLPGGQKRYDEYRFTGRAGDRVVITLNSAAMATSLIVRGPNGTVEQDVSSTGPNDPSRVELLLPQNGVYTILASSARPNQTGAYQLALAPGGATAAAAPSGPAPRGRQAQRVFALMVGISDYGGTANNLAYTAEDATNMANALRQAGVLSPQSVTLTEAQATVGAVRQAFARIAAEAGPDDVFLFFFSGHGSQTQGQVSATEMDGRTETIVLRDGQLTDADMAGLFQQVRAGVSILALDSCFSGGFARNVVNRPGVMGLFSSEEDLTSQVAANFRAGGYLSHFLRLALAGEADADGNGVITAGEVSAFLHRQFAQNVQNVSAQTMEGGQNYQNLVVDRGGVQIDQPILHLAANRRPIQDPQGGDGIPTQNPWGDPAEQAQEFGRPEETLGQDGGDQPQYDGQQPDEGGGKP